MGGRFLTRLMGCWRTGLRLDLSGPAAARARHGDHIERCALCRDAVLATEALQRDLAAGALSAKLSRLPASVFAAAVAGLAAAILLLFLSLMAEVEGSPSPGSGQRPRAGPFGSLCPCPHLRPPPVLPKKLASPQPEYPEELRKKGVQGEVVLDIVVGKDGSVSEAKVLHTAAPEFAEAARKAVLQWRYEPLFFNGRPVPFLVTVRVQFRLQQEEVRR
jgi:TonB family protein